MLAASIHYFRLGSGALARAMAVLRAMGFDTVESPVPWRVHARGGRLAFDRDDAHLIAFLEEAAGAGLAVHLRLGPCVGFEVTNLGLPESVAFDRDMAARLPSGEPQVLPFPPRWTLAPSYASAAYRESAGEWVAATCGAIRAFAGHGGPVRTVAVGDVRPFLGRSAALPGDRHPDANAAYQAARAALPEGDRDDRMPEVRPDRFDPDRPLIAIEAARFAETLYLDFLEMLRRRAADACDAAVVTSVPPGGMFQVVGAGRTAALFDAVGLDVYGRREIAFALERDLRLVVGSVRRPFASLVAAGAPPFLPHLCIDDHLFGLRAALAAGLGGIVVSAGVAHDRWIGGLIDEDLREVAELAAPVRRLVHGVARSGWLRLHRSDLAALVLPRDLVRAVLCASAVHLGPAAPDIAAALGYDPSLALDPGDPGVGGGAWWRWWQAAERALAEAGVPYVIIDDESPVEIDPDETPILMMPTCAAASSASIERLRRHVERGGAAIVGPARLERDLGTGDGARRLAGVVTVSVPEARMVRDALGAVGRLADLDGAADVASRRPGGVERSYRLDPADPAVVAGLVVANRSSGETAIGHAAGDGDWRDLDEPGSAPARGTIGPGEFRMLVPGTARRGVP